MLRVSGIEIAGTSPAMTNSVKPGNDDKKARRRMPPRLIEGREAPRDATSLSAVSLERRETRIVSQRFADRFLSDAGRAFREGLSKERFSVSRAPGRRA
jgi:hypothetical protein